MKDIVLGLHKDNWHDTGAAIVARDQNCERAIVHINEERLDRTKHSRSFPQRATDSCLKELGLSSVHDVDLVILDHTMNSEDWRRDYRKNPCRKDVFLQELPNEKIKIIRHHLCHAAASFYTSKFSEAAILIVDGRGSRMAGDDQSFETQTLWVGNGSQIELVEESSCIGIGLLYEAISQYLGFGFLEAGKTMRLAPFGETVKERVLNLEGTYEGLNTDYSHLCGIDNELMFEPPKKLSKQMWQRAAYDVQKECESAMLYLTRYARSVTRMPNLCLGGGVALNSVANGKIIKNRIFDKIYINPACDDSGIALGAALWGYHSKLDNARDFKEISPYVGPSYFKNEIQAAARNSSFIRLEENVMATICRLLAEDKVVGIFQGRSEMGPRALGNRSILMSPGKAKNRDHLNKIVKRREPFRPFAPCVPLERASEYFDTDEPSPYMLMVVDVRPEWRSRLPAITHVNGSARVQTVARDSNQFLYNLLIEFERISGFAVLLNTSFNIAGEPLVESPEDAIRCFENSNMDALMLEDILIQRNG